MLQEEKRKHPRIKCDFFAELCEDENSTLGVGEIVDLSEGGAGIESTTPFVAGQKTLIRFSLPDANETLVIVAEIVRTAEEKRSSGGKKFYGVRFTGALPETIERIKSFLEKYKSL